MAGTAVAVRAPWWTNPRNSPCGRCFSKANTFMRGALRNHSSPQVPQNANPSQMPKPLTPSQTYYITKMQTNPSKLPINIEPKNNELPTSRSKKAYRKEVVQEKLSSSAHQLIITSSAEVVPTKLPQKQGSKGVTTHVMSEERGKQQTHQNPRNAKSQMYGCCSFYGGKLEWRRMSNIK